MIVTLALLAALAPAVPAETCSHPRDLGFYEAQGYRVDKVAVESPFDFLFFVRRRLDDVRRQLPLAEGATFSRQAYDASFKLVEQAVQDDSAFGLSPAKIAVATASIERCREEEGGPRTLDVTYHLFSTNPLPSVRATPEDRLSAVDKPATAAGERNTQGLYKVEPALAYDPARGATAGGDVQIRFPGRVVNDFSLAGSDSSVSRTLRAQLSGSQPVDKTWLDRLDYHVTYDYTRLPAFEQQLEKDIVNLRLTGMSRSIDAGSAQLVVRYGGSIEKGHQESDGVLAAQTADTVTNSAAGAVRVYTGVTRMTRYSETAISYGLEVGGAGLSDLSFAKHVGDALYSVRFPGHTHAPWDLQARLTAGKIRSDRAIPITDRFFGGGSVSSFIPGDAWSIPAGPLVRSIATNRLAGSGAGGTSFFSTNLTVGKVIKSYPLIPPEVEMMEGFGTGIEAAESTAERFFADDYETSSSEYKALAIAQGVVLKADLDAVQATLERVRSGAAVTPEVTGLLDDADGRVRRAQGAVRNATVPDARGRVNALLLRTLLNPNVSLLQRLLESLGRLQPRVDATAQTPLRESVSALERHVSDLGTAMDTLHRGQVGIAAAARAAHDMARPREVIDTLRHEVNSFAVSLVGMFDAGRLWPDPFGVRYAVGVGARVSFLAVNLTAGYAFNPRPHEELGQERGAAFVSVSYTNLFR